MTGAFKLAIQATVRDTDAFGHVNNAVYVSWFEEVRTSYVCSRRGLKSMSEVDFILASTTVHFRSPVFMMETIEMCCAPIRIGIPWFLIDTGTSYHIDRTPRGEPGFARGRW